MRLGSPALPILFGVISLVFGMGMAPKAASPEKPATAAKTAANTQPKKAGSPSAPAAKNAEVDKQTVQDLYQGGEFEQLIALLENMRRERRLRDRDDSVFIYKYLGVVYGADMNTRRKAESFLYQMLKLDPSQDLEDLEVGDAILSMFREVRKRYDRTANDSLTASEREHVKKSLKTYGYPIDSTGKNLVEVRLDSNANSAALAANQGGETGSANSQGKTGSAAAGQETSDRRWLWVAGGAAAVTLVGIGAIMLMSEPETKTTTLVTEVK